MVGGLSAVAIAKIGGLGLSFLSHVVLARVTTVEEYGIYIYVWGWIVVLAYVSRAGFDNVVERYVSKFRAEERWQELRGVLRRAIQYTGGFGILVGAVGGMLIWVLGTQLSSSMQLTFWYGFVLLPILTCVYIVQSGLRGLKRVGQAFIPELIVRNVVLIAACGALWFFFGAFEAWGIMGLTLGSFVVALGAGAYLLRRALPQQAKYANIDYGSESWLRKALPFMLFAGTSLLQRKADILMLGILAEARDVGIYGVAIRITSLIVLPLVIVNRTMRPHFSEKYTDKKNEDLQWLVSACVMVISPITILIGIVLLASGPQILSLFGSEYAEGYGILLILMGGQVIAALTGPVGVFLIMTDREQSASRIEGTAALANIVLNGALIPYLGAEGAAVATAVTLASRNVAFAYVVRVRHGINPTIFNPNIISILKTKLS